MRVGLRLERWIPEQPQAAADACCAALLLGVLVSLSSIGAGAIGATLIMLLYPRLPNRTAWSAPTSPTPCR